MEDALWAQLQNTGLEEHDDKDRIEAESDEEQEVVQEVSLFSILSPTNSFPPFISFCFDA